ncbi:hypothetical protein HPS57_07855 [Prevotella sp. PINT]|uniref:hypothetical protein n=1 Tax=Palleniella intestinalis TaxID=2736291 RepID=UPI001552447A|nr:hypothetical protein [Palleniella intestinalis]NPD81888.1 hypothetical protein [Palleniella intestinalis]
MKKIFITAVLCIGAMSANAKVAERTDAVCIITECGTQHRIPSGSTPADIDRFMDLWTADDCR